MYTRMAIGLGAVVTIMTVAVPATLAAAGERHDPAAEVAALDTRYQAAVKANDAATMSRILAEDFVLVTGTGHTFTRDDLIGPARTQDCVYEHQEEVAGTQTVRVFGSQTAVVTAQLWEKGQCKDGSSFDDHLWFSDTYIHRDGHWTYVFGQASRPL
jgi:ketosteroid isomerase-like protein